MPATPTRPRVSPRALPSLGALRKAVFASPRDNGTWDVTCAGCGPVRARVALARVRWTVMTRTSRPATAAVDELGEADQ